MASLDDILGALNTKEASVDTAEVAGDLKASVEGTRKQLKRLKDRGYVGGDSQEGWLISDEGKKALERGGVTPKTIKTLEGGRVIPSMIGEGVTPRQKFEEIGQLIGIRPERITLATRLVWSGDYNDLVWVWNALGQVDIDIDLRKVWTNSWRAHLKKGIPAELEPILAAELEPHLGDEGKVEGKRAAEGKPREGRSYILDENDMPLYVGEGLGDLIYRDAVDLAKLR
ncbi:unnamed protein product, partial [marine sediment metagenome]